MNVCVYGASSTQIDQQYIKQTEMLGEKLAENGHSLVYGAGGAGLMGAVARGVKRAGGYVVGVVPSFLKVDGVLYDNCDELIYTETMRERKQIMEERSQAFIVTPGGIGTYEEFFEIYTLKQLGRHHKPIILFNVNGYYDAIVAMLRQTVDEKFMREESLRLLTVATSAEEAIEQLNLHQDAMDIHSTKFV